MDTKPSQRLRLSATVTGSASRRDRRRALLVAMCLAGLAVALAGCGYTAGSTQGATSGGTPTTPGGSSGPGRGTTVRPCTGPNADVAVEGQPALTLTEATPNQTGTVAVGGLVQVQLQGTWSWRLASASSNLVATQYQGAFDQTRSICFWNFRAHSAGTAHIALAGTALCEPPKECPAIARGETFTVQVS